MGKIKTLKEEVFRKIAAGEVVERPLSVVKELVENAIDANASEIKVEIQHGGKEMIRVSDNGEGFQPEDIEPAFARHSTSKISELADFNHLTTLGFRGEALSSILEVSKIKLRTSANTEGKGTCCAFENNQLTGQEEIAFNQGTTIEVRDLFYNFPVRKKFLKSERTELNQIIAFLEPISLVNYHISFSLVNDSRTLFMYNKVSNLSERIYQVFGKDFLDTLQEVNFEYLQYKLTGFISKLNTGVSVKKYQYFFVNKRPIREKTLIAALNNTFQDYLEKHKSPVGILILDIPPHEVDVNIHPMKLEIKFENASAIYQLIKGAVAKAFGREPEPAADIHYPIFPGQSKEQGFPQAPFPASENRPPQPSFAQARLFAQDFYSEQGFYLLGQYKNSYIIVEKDEALLIIDQHNAQERINFDRLKTQYQEDKIAAISPLFPIIIELTPSEISLLDDTKKKLLERMGFDIQPMSANAFDVKRFPQILAEKNIKDTILTILQLQEGEDQAKFEDQVLAEIACKGAVKVNTRLHPEQMKSIVNDLFDSTNPHFCPHKRPIIIDFTLEQIEKLLKRK